MHPQQIVDCLNATQMLIKALKDDDKYMSERFNLITLRDNLKTELRKHQPVSQPSQ